MKYGTVGVTTLILTTALYACTHLPTGISQSPPPGQPAGRHKAEGSKAAAADG